MASHLRAIVFTVLLSWPAGAAGEVLVRWELEQVPAREALGISTLLVPAGNRETVVQALASGYAVYVEVDGPVLPAGLPGDRLAGAVVRSAGAPERLRALRQRLTAPTSRVLQADTRGKWPHVRLNWVTRRNDVLVVSSRTEQPWLENNGALVRMARAGEQNRPPLLSYSWQPITISDVHQGPGRDNYLVAIAEAGTFGSDLVLPLSDGFQRDLLLGKPAARETWDAIRRYIEFYSWDLPRLYAPLANIGVVTSDPLRDFELLNLLTRHNLPFELIQPGGIEARTGAPLDLVIVLDPPSSAEAASLAEFARRGGSVVLGPGDVAVPLPWREGQPLEEAEEHVSYALGRGRVLERRGPVLDPNAFAMQMREALGPDRRVVDIWNGITVLAAPYVDPSGDTVMLPVLNYAHEPLPVQIRVKGSFATVHFETPGERPVLIPFQQRGGFTEFVLPELRIGGRVFLARPVAPQ